jgi:hypothetical protein
MPITAEQVALEEMDMLQIPFVGADAEINTSKLHRSDCSLGAVIVAFRMAQQGIPNLAHRGRPGQEWQSLCNLAISKMATPIGSYGLWSTSSPHHVGRDQPNHPTKELPLGMSLKGGERTFTPDLCRVYHSDFVDIVFWCEKVLRFAREGAGATC